MSLSWPAPHGDHRAGPVHVRADAPVLLVSVLVAPTVLVVVSVLFVLAAGQPVLLFALGCACSVAGTLLACWRDRQVSGLTGAVQ